MKFFTIEEANETLRKVRPELEKMRCTYREILSYRRELRQVVEAAKNGGGGMRNGGRYLFLMTELMRLTNCLNAQGIEIKDFSRGLIDFPSIRDGRAVLLCWQFGDGEEVEWWHERQTGFAGRKPL